MYDHGNVFLISPRGDIDTQSLLFVVPYLLEGSLAVSVWSNSGYLSVVQVWPQCLLCVKFCCGPVDGKNAAIKLAAYGRGIPVDGSGIWCCVGSPL
jgi:hypothetical protein